MSSPSRTGPLRRARRLASLGLVGLLSLPLIAWSSSVEVAVDGEVHDVRTYAGTVDEVLDELDVDVAGSDEVSPRPDAPVSDGLEIEVERAVTVDVLVDGRHARRVTDTVGSVAGVLESAGMGDLRERGAEIAPGWTAPVDDGDEVRVSLPREVTVVDGGDEREVTTHVSTVRRLLLEQDIDVDGEDEVSPSPGTPLSLVHEVAVDRIAVEEVTEEVTLDWPTERRETDELLRGREEVAQAGREGLRVDTYEVRRVNGEEVERELVDQTVEREPQPRIVRVGTRAPEPATSSAPSGSVWDRLAQCESGGNWSANTGNGYYGGLQFHASTWNAHKPAGYPAYAHQASRAQQITVAKSVKASQGWAAWPSCSRQLGLR